MFLKAFKEKSNQKFVENSLKNRKVDVSEDKVTSIGVLLNYTEYFDIEVINAFLSTLNIAKKDQHIFTFVDAKNKELIEIENSFSKKDFGWKGKLKNLDLKNFTETNFDVLICYYLAKCPELDQIAVMSSANFKVGISNEDERIYDLIINDKTKDFKVFKTELIKYLTILNKLK